MQIETFHNAATNIMKEEIQAFTKQKTRLFNYDRYNEKAVEALMKNINNADFIIENGYLSEKRKMLSLLEEVLAC